MLALGFTLVPLDGKGQVDLAQLLDDPSTYFSSLPAHVYQLIKTAILWAPVGFLYTLAGGSRVIRSWAPLGLLVLLTTGMVMLPNPGFRMVLEVLFAIPGLALGMWVASRTGIFLPALSPEMAASAQGVGMPLQASKDPKKMASGSSPPSVALPGLAVNVSVMLLIVVASWSLYHFPFMQATLAIGLVMYGALLWRFPSAWLMVVPAALPLLDLAHWSGRVFWDEFDLLMLTTLAVASWQGRFRLSAFAVPRLGGLLGLFVLVWLASLLIGLFPLQAPDANAFSSYWSHYNSLRLAKGLLWGLVFYGLYRSQADDKGAFTKLSLGMAMGALGVSLWALWEQAMFAGAATTADYRVTAGFSSMHTGGGHIEAYLVIALPFVWGLLFRLRNIFYRLLAGLVFLLGAYALLFTVARGGAIALAMALLILMTGTWLTRRKQAGPRAGLAMPIILGGLTIVVMVAGVSGIFWKQRIEQTATDAGVRFRHWAEVLDMRDASLMTTLFGQGLGSLPATNLASQLPDKAGSYRYKTEGNNNYLALNSAGTLYMAQRVVPHPDEVLSLELSVRAPTTQAGLEASLCEKILFNSRQCQWLKVEVTPGETRWQQHAQTFNSGEVGAGNWLTRRPVQFSLYNPKAGTVVEVDNVRLLDSRGRNLLKNGDFSQGGDFWFFKSGDHLFWHAKNLWVHLLFEQGWLGAMLFGLIAMLALTRLMRAMGHGEMEATVLLAVMAAWGTVGMVDSLVDAPRLALLLYGLLMVSAAWGSKPAGKKRRRKHARHSHAHGERSQLADTA